MRVRTSSRARRLAIGAATAFGLLALFAGVAGPASHHAPSTAKADVIWFHTDGPNDVIWF